jgi:hypothetical protein
VDPEGCLSFLLIWPIQVIGCTSNSGHDNPSIYHYGTKELTALEWNQAEITASPIWSGRGEVKEKVISHLSEFFESTNQPSINPSLCFFYSTAFHKHNRIPMKLLSLSVFDCGENS